MKASSISSTLAVALASATCARAEPAATVANCYQPIQGGWEIRISNDANAPKLAAGSRIGVVEGQCAAAPPAALSAGGQDVGVDGGGTAKN